MPKEIIDGELKFRCPGCGRLFSNGKSLSGHTHGCSGYHGQDKRNPRIITEEVDGRKIYKCPGCGFSSDNSRALAGHVGKCKSYLGEERYSRVLANQLNYSKKPKPGRSLAFASGKLQVNTNYGKNSRFREYYFRSSYEAIFAVYLMYLRADFSYEDVRVRYLNKTYISDFRIKNLIIEIKGYASDKCKFIEEAFIHNGYDFRILYQDQIDIIYQELLDSGVNIDELYSKLFDPKYSRLNPLIWDYNDDKVQFLN